MLVFGLSLVQCSSSHLPLILLTEFISQIFQKTNNFDENHKIINKNIKVVNLDILKVKTWFGDKDLFS